MALQIKLQTSTKLYVFRLLRACPPSISFHFIVRTINSLKYLSKIIGFLLPLPHNNIYTIIKMNKFCDLILSFIVPDMVTHFFFLSHKHHNIQFEFYTYFSKRHPHSCCPPYWPVISRVLQHQSLLSTTNSITEGAGTPSFCGQSQNILIVECFEKSILYVVVGY